MKAPDLRSWLGANRSDSRRYREDEQQRQGRKDKLSCSVNCEADHDFQAATGTPSSPATGSASSRSASVSSTGSMAFSHLATTAVAMALPSTLVTVRPMSRK